MSESFKSLKSKNFKGKHVLAFNNEQTPKPFKDKSSLIKESFLNASKRVAPLWDVRDYVAVNPFFGFKENNFLDTAKYLGRISSKSLFPKKEFFLDKFERGEITEYDLEIAIKLFESEFHTIGEERFSTEELLTFLKSPNLKKNVLSVRALSDLYDLENQENVTDEITIEISRWLSAYFDEGQALWKVEKNGLRLFSWWRSLVRYDKPLKGINNDFSKLIKSLPSDPQKAIHHLVEKLFLKIPLDQNHLEDYFYRLFYTILGWSSYLQKFEFEASRSGDYSRLETLGGIIDILAIRMTYDLALLDEVNELNLLKNDNQDDSLKLSYIWLNAAENAYRRKVEETISLSNNLSLEKTRPLAQMAFCIDVRSEVLRRQLEKCSKNIETLGFAGFFGVPISVKSLAHKEADQNCPVLLNPTLEIHESCDENEQALIKKKLKFAEGHYFKKSIQSSANSGFSFVETFGFGYAGKILLSGLGIKKPNDSHMNFGLSLKDQEKIHLDIKSIPLEKLGNLAFGALKNMGLTKNFAPFVFFFGHGSESTNNPYASGLDCGACAGHNGKRNAEFLAKILNEKEVREFLFAKGIDIPKDTVFVSGWHNTVKDDLITGKVENLSKEQEKELEVLKVTFSEAVTNCRKERARNLPWFDDLNSENLKAEMDQKALDWSEIRPEWGLARNASFIVGRRELTRALNLEGRSFLHDYNAENDSDLSTLELIMTAPMIVTNWINMQYFASTIDPRKFGAGNKVLNNVVGGIGCVEGNGSDLLGGLSEQSVWYNGEYFHEPIRLQVFIEADPLSIDQIINKHQMVWDLLNNGWLRVVSINPKNRQTKIYHVGNWINIKEDLWN